VAPCPVGNLTVKPDAVKEQVAAVAPVTTREYVPPSLILLSVIPWQFTLVVARLLSPKSMVAAASESSDLTDFFVQHGYSFNFVFKGLQEVPDPIAIRLASAW